MKISFIYNKRLSIYPLDYMNRGLGGTEQTMILISEELAKLGHEVNVYASCYKTGTFNKVKWKNLWQLNEKDNSEVYISVRFIDVFDDFTLNKQAIKVLWCHDDNLPNLDNLFKSNKLDFIFAVSECQKRLLIQSGIKEKYIYLTANVFDPKIYKPVDDARKKQFIYCSSPDRGLIYLLEMWPKIKRIFPEYSLKVTGSFELWGLNKQENYTMTKSVHKKIQKLKDVEYLGKVEKRKLAKLQSESFAMLYPSDFLEMFCISILECQAVGTPIITSKLGAIVERVKNKEGFLISGKPSSKHYQNKFINRLYKLKDHTIWMKMSTNCVNTSQEFTPNKIANDWISFLERRIK